MSREREFSIQKLIQLEGFVEKMIEKKGKSKEEVWEWLLNLLSKENINFYKDKYFCKKEKNKE